MTNEQDPVTLADKLTIRMRAYAASEKGSDNEARQAIALADLIGRNEKAIERAILTQHGRHEGLREAIAELVHGAMVWAAQARGGEPKPWQEGNSTAEDEARRTARKIAALSTDTAQPMRAPRMMWWSVRSRKCAGRPMTGAGRTLLKSRGQTTSKSTAAR